MSQHSQPTHETVAWECGLCGRRHLWKWPHGDAAEGRIVMHCDDVCGGRHLTEMVRIGASAWAALWRQA